MLPSGTAKRSEKRGRMKIAMVGASDPLTFDDRMRLDVASIHIGHATDDLDIINLNNGRDFLIERRRYDAVILHSIFHSNRPYAMKLALRTGGTNSSLVHSIERWRKRLVSTHARVIVVWELLPAALSGWNLGDLPQYRTKYRDHRITVYKRAA